MSEAAPNPPLLVFLNNRLAGRLARGTHGGLAFHYDADWLGWEHALPVSLSLPLREHRYGDEAASAVFEHLLPRSAETRRRIAERMGAAGSDAFSLLAAIGRDCVGALTFVAEGDGAEPSDHGIQGDILEEGDLERTIAGLEGAPLGLGRDIDPDFRLSLPGDSHKTALLFHAGKWKRPHGRTPTTHILKPRIGRRLAASGGMVDLSNSVENEYYCLKLLAAFGLPARDCEIRTFGESKVLVVERFDRHWTRDIRLIRLPQENALQALAVPPPRGGQAGPGIAALAGLLKGGDDPLGDLRVLLTVQILFWLLGIANGHAGKFGLALGPGGRFRLAPLHGLLTLQPAVDAGQVPARAFRLPMAVGEAGEDRVDKIAGRHFLESAGKARIPALLARDAVGAVVARAAEAFDWIEQALPPDFPGEIHDSVRKAATFRLARLEKALDRRKS